MSDEVEKYAAENQLQIRAEALLELAESAAKQAKTSASDAEATANDLRRTKSDKRPHNYTLILSLASVVISIVAAMTSWRSYGLSERGLQISQRAYIELVSRKIEWVQVEGAARSRRARISLIVKNSGNTPATFTGGFSSAHAAQNWPIISNDGERKELSGDRLPLPIGGKDEASWSDEFTFDVPEKAIATPTAGDTVLLTGILTYRDVFESDHQVRWCNVYIVVERTFGECTIQLEKLITEHPPGAGE